MAPGDNDGATPRELILEACRRNNTDLLHETLSGIKPSSSVPTPPTADSSSPTEAAVAHLLNTITDPLGATPLHIAALAGALEALDILLDQPGVETDPQERREGDTPLHRAVKYVNELGDSQTGSETREAAWEEGLAVVEILIDAGCDPRIRNKAKLKPVDVVDVRNEKLKGFLRRSEVMMVEGEGIVEEDEDEAEGTGSESD